MLKKRKGQSLLEYVLLMTIMILVIIYAANNVLKPRATKQVDAAGTLLDNAISVFTASTVRTP